MPFYQARIRTALSQGELVQAMRDIVVSELVAEQGSSGPSLGKGQFVGSVDGVAFAMRRMIGYKNSFLPQICARIDGERGESVLVLKMYLSPFMSLFMAFWFSALGYSLYCAVRDGIFSSPEFWMPLGLICFGAFLLMGAFYSEAFIAKKVLMKALAGET